MKKVLQHISTPTILWDKEKSISNLKRMMEKVKKSGVEFRPHFKTHQSLEVGKLFKEEGVKKITVSSLKMAEYFSSEWNDITVAFPVNIREVDLINNLSGKIKLNLLVENVESAKFLEQELENRINVFIKIDCGYKRTGIDCNNTHAISELVELIEASSNLNMIGLLTHSGNTYNHYNKNEILDIYNSTVEKMNKINSLFDKDYKISVGDTPSCSLVDEFKNVDEVRPGNFVFYDAMQSNIGSCTDEDIAIAVACPVIAKHKDRNEITIYGGGVHLSKDSYNDKYLKTKSYGKVVCFNDNGWSVSLVETFVKSVSQEHGIIKTTDEQFNKFQIGDLIGILPAHSCLTVNLLKEIKTFNDQKIRIMD